MSDRFTVWELVDRDAMLAFGCQLGRSLPTQTVLLLFGDLGSGKTTFVQGLGIGLGITDPILSPTFTLVCEYHEGRLPLYHLDLYRLEPQEVTGLSPEIYWEGVEVTPGITAIEWAGRLPYLPPHYWEIHLEIVGEKRRVKIVYCGEDQQRILKTDEMDGLGKISNGF